MTLNELLKDCGAVGNYDGSAAVISVCCDSRRVERGGVFIALRGQRADGVRFAEEAARRGAVCMVCEGFPKESFLPVASVSDCRRAAALIFSRFYGECHRELFCVGVTGTNGKTTVSSLLGHILSCDGRKTGLLGTVDKSMGDGGISSEGDPAVTADTMTTPDPESLYKYLYLMRKNGCDSVVLEASSHALAYSKLDGMHVDVGVMTNLTPEHLDFHASMENYYRAKRRLAQMSKRFVVNYDDPFGKRLCAEFPQALAVSADPESAADSRVFATAAMYRSRGLSGVEYMFCSKDTVFPVKTCMVGRNALYNTAVAAAAALVSGVSAQVIREAIASFGGVKGRFEIVCRGQDIPSVIIDYAHTPDSFEKALADTRGLMSRGQRLILVFGCGGERDSSKRSVMGALAEKYADILIITDDNPRGEEPSVIREQILEGVLNKGAAEVVEDREQALRRAVLKSTARDVILVLGKGHEEYIIDKKGKREFHERDIIKTCVFDKFGTV